MTTTEMKVMELPSNFYSELQDALEVEGEGIMDNGDLDDSEYSKDIELFLDFGEYGCVMQVYVTFSAELVDESFDHAFGTYYAEPYYQVVWAKIEAVSDIHFYDDNNNEVTFSNFNVSDLENKDFDLY